MPDNVYANKNIEIRAKISKYITYNSEVEIRDIEKIN